jgi:moderate conductance mechanosensitive channel
MGVPQEVTDACGSDPSWICEQVLDASDGNEFAARTSEFRLAKPLTIALIIILALIANRILRRAANRISDRVAAGAAPGGMMRSVIDKTPGAANVVDARTVSRAHTIGQVIRSIGSAVIFVVASLLILGELGIDLAPLLAGAGIAGIAIGFGAQSLVRDFLSGFFMLIEDQYGVGDVVDLGEAAGQVEQVSLRATRLRDAEGTVWHVPNGEIRRVGNKSQQWARAVVDVAVAYGTDINHATLVIEEVAHQLRNDEAWAPKIQEDPEVLGVESLGADGVNIRLSVQTEPGEQFAVMRELRMRLRQALDAAGIDPPFQRTKYVGGPPGEV